MDTMDFIESLDLETSNQHRKSDRVRSWYLMEQYKALEINQLEAAKRLRARSYQEGILLREMNERKARRQLYDEIGFYDRGPSPPPLPSDIADSSIFSIDDSYKSFCDSQDDISRTLENLADKSTDTLSLDETKLYEDLEFKSVEEKDFGGESEASIRSVVENVNRLDTAEDTRQCMQEEINSVKKDIEDNLKLQLDTLMQSIKSTEKQNKLRDEGVLVDCRYDCVEQEKKMKAVNTQKYGDINSMSTLWFRVVRFAYQVMKLQRGNCYQEYSSQIMTAVLALDIFRRSLCDFCHYLQPYVSPIKYIDSNSVVSEHDFPSKCEVINCCKRRRYKRKICRYQIYQRSRSKRQRYSKLQTGDVTLSPKIVNDYLITKRDKKGEEKSNESGSNVADYLFSKEINYSSTNTGLWTEDTSQMETPCASTKVTNPMLKVIQLIDNAIKFENYHKII